MRPALETIPQPFHRYVNLVQEDDVRSAFGGQEEVMNFFRSLPSDKHNYRYAAGKWTLKEMLQHIIDAERVFCYRALVFARNDTVELPSFDEDAYALNSNASSRDWDDLLEEFNQLRSSSMKMFTSFNEDQLNASGIASKNSITVLGLGYVIVGHVLHHVNVIRERYI